MTVSPNLARRRFLKLALGGAALGLLGACAPAAAPTPTPAPAKPAEKPAEKPAQPTPTPAAQAKPAAPTGAKVITIWRGTDYSPLVNQGLREFWTRYAQEAKVEINFEEKSGQWMDQLNAAVQAGTPPDIVATFDYQVQYWRGQGQAIDVSDVVAKYKNAMGGLFDYVVATVGWQGKFYGVPLAVNAWPFHVRQDLMDKHGFKWAQSWDEFRRQGKELTRAPQFYAYGYCLGKINDTNNHFLGTLWTFGGALQKEDGSLGASANDPAWLEALRLTKVMYEEDKIIPPGAINWTDADNNNAYQGEQIAWTSNPTSIYTWLEKNKPELAKATKFYPYPKGPAGSFGQVDVWSHIIFKASKVQEEAKGALEYVFKPENHAKYIEFVQGRFLPVYRELVDAPFWKKSEVYAEYANIARNGRIMAHAASPTAPYAEITTTFLIGEMMQDLLVRKQKPEEALATFVKRAQAIYDKYKGQL
jgi:multiple sugar transport system substrate-binding protein